jgi:choline kinase
VKICLGGGRIVDFGKIIQGAFDAVGEWPGFLRLEPASATELATTADRFLATGRHEEPYEPAIREILLTGSPERFGVEDITGLPWIEIDTPEDLRRAHETIAPALDS